MKTEEAKSLISLIRDSSAADVTVVSFVILPILLAAWSLFLNSLSALETHVEAKGYLLAVLLVIYIGGVFIMKLFESTKGKRERAAQHIRNRLERRNTHLGSFDYIRRTVNPEYSDPFLLTILDEFPDDFRRAQIKGGKLGLALNESSEEGNT
ncbi:MAG: hypothetical protein ABJF10_22875 [Chthoniobacter sp.]|uniref:hypothetical protein n=1 Tax=Chthoniobacter sp. TaxID=2510640 RepID=UPI0032A27D80